MSLLSLEARGSRTVNNGTHSSVADANYTPLCGTGYPARAWGARTSGEGSDQDRMHPPNHQTWTVKDEKMVWKILTGIPNQYDMTIRGQPETWSMEKWREAYGFDAGGEGFTSRTNKFIGGKFRNPVNSKEGYAFADCEDVRVKRG